jgi:hypothetical protein
MNIVFAPPVYSSGPSVPGVVALAVGFAGQLGPGHFPVVGLGPAPLLDAEAPGAGLGQFAPPGHLEVSPAGAGVSPPAGQFLPPGQAASAGGRTAPPGGAGDPPDGAGAADPPDGPGAWTCPSGICETGLPLGPGAWTWPSGICLTGVPLGAGASVAVAGGGVGLPQPSVHGSVMVTGTGVASQTWHSLVVTVKPSGTWSLAEAHVGVASEHDSVTV